MFKTMCFTCLAAIILTLANTAVADQEVGRAHGGIPYKELPYGNSVYDSAKCSLIVHTEVANLKKHSLLAAVCDGRVQAWLNRYEKQDPPNPAGNYVVVDFVSLGTLTKGQFSSSPFCSVNKSQNHFEWVAIYRGEGRKKYTLKNGGIVQGWVINPKTARFELASPEILKNIECIPEEYD